MRKVVIGSLLCFSLLLPTSTFADSQSKNDVTSFKTSGYVQDTRYEENRISTFLVEKKAIQDNLVKADLELVDGVVSGTIHIPNATDEYLTSYELTSTASFNEFEGHKANGYTGIVNNGELHFEMFILEDGNAVINIFELDEDENRIHPFTINLDGDSKPKIETSTEFKTILSEENEIALMNTGDMTRTNVIVSNTGIRLDTFTTPGMSERADWITRLRPVVREANTLASQPSSAIQQTWLYEAQIQNGMQGTGRKQTINPASPGTRNISFSIPFTTRDIPIFIPISRTNINSTANVQTLRVWYQLNLARASSYETDGIAAHSQLVMPRGMPLNSNGQAVITQNTWLKYEYVGHIREYATTRADATNYYRPVR
ncbi:hypothetical protein M3212_08685 [Alkalihalobacillus oceani]|uniref:hypothetical protein n=1 Tax=Halalkalibacter oceani TaxID=1653776 RepID=UPI00203F14CE|nr:hypothetical protein [Halalkalibacter oceani]MCM3760864.1 hypothetical protein [Halalkalibacter oceani]